MEPHFVVWLGTVFVLIFAVALLGFRLVKLGFRNWQKREEVPNKSDLLVDVLRERMVTVKETQTELEASQQAYRDLFAMYKTLMEEMPLGLMESDRDYTIAYANRTALTWLNFETPASLGTISQPLLNVVQSLYESGRDNTEFAWYDNENGNRSWSVGLKVLPGDRRLIIISDRTEMAALEQRLATDRELALMGEMASGIAHEVKNVMGVVQAHAQMIQLGTGSENAEPILAESQRLLQVVQQFMRFAKQEQPQWVQVDVHDWLVEFIAKWRNRGYADRIVLEENLSPHRHASWDPVLMDLALDNIVENALQSCDEEAVTIRVVARKGEWVIEVEDRGPGFSKEVLNRLFVPFVTSKPNGTGLGLFHARKIVSSHQGKLEVMPDPTRVRIVLPLDEREP
ncbi:MAG: hypothetical protein KDC35_03755 [Acidobacteria bacterium]|nr:hypothetical protein [Acidobacteriota bacterium]